MAYNPGIEYRGDQYLFRGITGAADALAGAIKEHREERKQAKAADTALGAVGTAIEKLTEQGALPPGLLKQFAAVQDGTTEQKKAFIQGTGQVFSMLQEQGQAANRKAYLDMQKENQRIAQAHEQERLAAEARRKAYNLGLARYLDGPAGITGDTTDTGQAPKLTEEDALRVAAEAGVADPGTTAQLALDRGARGAAGAGREPKLMSFFGRDYVWDPVRGLLPNPGNGPDAGGPIEAQPILDEKGEVIGYGIDNGKGHIVRIPSPKKTPPDGTPVQGQPGYVWFNGRPWAPDPKVAFTADLRSGMAGGGAATNQPAPPKPGTEKRLVWDGSQWKEVPSAR